jgi:hypothetical protein
LRQRSVEGYERQMTPQGKLQINRIIDCFD